jgi:uncharacterized protein (DUF736 family)
MRQGASSVCPNAGFLAVDGFDSLVPGKTCSFAVLGTVTGILSVNTLRACPTRTRLADQTRGTASASIAFPQRLQASFFPLPRRRGIPRGSQKSRPFAILRGASGPAGRGPIAPGLWDRHRGRYGRGPSKQTEIIMATIGTFTASENGYTGSIKTLTLNIKAKFVASEKEHDYRILAGATEFGAAWKKTARDSKREYLSVKLDDPSFPAPLNASLVKVDGDDSFTLIWSRRACD